jgi:transcriptional regulator with XRE-family HTH domain
VKITRGVRRNDAGKVRRNLVGKRVLQARLRLSPPVTQEDLAGRLAIRGIQLDRSAVARIESGDRYVLDFELVVLAKALKVTTAFLLGEHRLLP